MQYKRFKKMEAIPFRASGEAFLLALLYTH